MVLKSLRECSKTRCSPHDKVSGGRGQGAVSADFGGEGFVAAYVLTLDTCNCSVLQSGCLVLPVANNRVLVVC